LGLKENLGDEDLEPETEIFGDLERSEDWRTLRFAYLMMETLWKLGLVTIVTLMSLVAMVNNWKQRTNIDWFVSLGVISSYWVVPPLPPVSA